MSHCMGAVVLAFALASGLGSVAEAAPSPEALQKVKAAPALPTVSPDDIDLFAFSAVSGSVSAKTVAEFRAIPNLASESKDDLRGLKEDDYPNPQRIEDWPSWDLPILKWGKEQGGVVGFSHSGWGLAVKAQKLPTLEMPPFDGIGANEYVVDVVHDACDFISAVDTPCVWELNVWYHTLNCGYQCRISGETDFPCIYGERVGLGRAYVRLDEHDPKTPLD